MLREVLREAVKARSLNLSLYLNKYPPYILFPEVLTRFNDVVMSSGGLRRLSIFLLDKEFLEVERDPGRQDVVKFFENAIQGKLKDIQLSYSVKLSKDELAPYEKFFDKWVELLCNRISPKTPEIFETESRLVVGLGDESIYETSIRLLRNYGVPYIPGSALKGVSRLWSIYILADLLKKEEVYSNVDFYTLAEKVQRALDGRDEEFYKKLVSTNLEDESLSNVFRVSKLSEAVKLVREIFGTTETQGSVVFFDALPLPESLKEKPALELDIMNPHYPNYYQGNEPPGDWQDPRPLFFLTVPRGVRFAVAVAPRDESTENLVKVAFGLLTQALQGLGVGAKTSLGYGRLKLEGV
ncbi:hypothetical protein A3L04_09050 [Thermococcus chitonophagus]|uniref:CRISPR-associated RAMP Cmr6 n=1 Tax=Thermococcus chitonophagus TaxID=54262 RepID=A0A160VTI1_9EURY|nr:type III-B CRISPR module RAMP protein Cmr6 [Thermococcus chitonophagus]ASJ17201.1 hypothetical protein A3L04_09050 [Thermococcus chitonophagus]CUX77816.1 CRISPR-associated RAMP Cmr6 [Thermococcus chitonophagus]